MDQNIGSFRQGMYDSFPNPAELEALGLYMIEQSCCEYAPKGLFMYFPVFEKRRKKTSQFYRACKPESPLLITDVDSSSRAIIEKVRFPGVRFDRDQVIEIGSGATGH